MAKHIVKKGRKIKGFVYQSNGMWFYSFGRPSQYQTIAFACRSLEHGIACIELPTLNH